MDCGRHMDFEWKIRQFTSVNSENKNVAHQEKNDSTNNPTGVQWAPLNVSLRRRLQTLAMVGKMFIVFVGEPFCLYLMYWLLYSSLWSLALIYLMWIVFDLDICDRGGRMSNWVKNWSWWRYYCEYFPLELVKSADLDNSRNYIFGCFPHGFISFGAFGVFGTNGVNFQEKFPGMTPHMITLRGRFLVPFIRELFLAWGGCSASLHSLTYLLDPKKYKGNCIALVVGGSAEAMYSHPEEYTALLTKRKGFVRLAMTTGTPLVPVITFGENDVYRSFKVPEGSLKRRFQEWYLKTTGLFPVIPSGRGLFQYSFGLLPFRRPLTVVVGAPLEVQKNLDPSREEVNLVHAQFMDSLHDLFEKEKHKYVKHPEKVHLVIK